MIPLLAVLCFSNTVPAPTPTIPRMTQSQAISRAARFLTAIAKKPIAKPTAVFGVSNTSPPNRLDSHWESRWQVTFPDEADVQVVDRTGVVSYYWNSAWHKRMRQSGDDPPGDAIPESEAVSRAASALKATGVQDDLLFASAQLNQHTNPPTTSGHSWSVVWRRAVGNIPYNLPEAVNMGLHADSGELMGFSLTFLTSPPPQVSTPVLATLAEARARERLGRKGAEDAQHIETVASIVMPADFTVPGASRDLTNGPSRFAWIVRFQARYPYSSPVGAGFVSRISDVFVDAATGGVIGGEDRTWRHIGPDAVPKKFAGSLQSASGVKVYKRGKMGLWEKTPVISEQPIGAASDFRKLFITQEASVYKSIALPDLKIEFTFDDGTQPIVVSYVCSSGMAGIGDSWHKAPESLRTRLNSLVKPLFKQ